MEIRIVTPKDMWNILRRCWPVMLAAALAVMALLFGWSRLVWEAKYQSTATLYILPRAGAAAEFQDGSGDFSLALDVMDDCAYLLSSHAVTEQVVEELSLSVSCEQLQKLLSVTNPAGTRFLEVTVKAETPGLAQEIADRICEVGADKIEQTMGLGWVDLYEEGTLETEPCNGVGLLGYAFSGAAAAVLTYCGYLTAFIFCGTKENGTGKGTSAL